MSIAAGLGYAYEAARAKAEAARAELEHELTVCAAGYGVWLSIENLTVLRNLGYDAPFLIDGFEPDANIVARFVRLPDGLLTLEVKHA